MRTARTEESDQPYLSTGAVATRVRLSRHTVLRAVRDGIITPTYTTPGGYHRFAPSVVDAYERVRGAAHVAATAPIARMHRAAETTTSGVVIQDPSGTILFANDAAERILGLSAAQLRGRTSRDPRWRALRPNGTDLPGEEHPAMNALRTGEAQRGVVLGVRLPEGARRWLQVDAVPLRDDAQMIVQVVCTFTDITERHLAEGQARAMYEAMPCAVMVVDEGGVVREANAAAQELLGVCRSTLLGAPLAETTGPSRHEDGSPLPVSERPTGRALATGEAVHDVVFELTRLDRERRWLHASAVPLVDGAGVGGRRVVASFIDITARKEAEARLRASEERYRQVEANAPISLAVVSLDGHWLRVNAALCTLTGYDEAELLALTFQDITHPDDLDNDLAFLRRVLAGASETYRIDKRYIRKDRSLVWIRLSVSLVRDDAHKPLYFIAQIEDIDEWKRAEAAVRTSEQRLRVVTNGAPVILTAVDAAGIVTLSVGQGLAAIGRTPNETVGRSIFDVLGPKSPGASYMQRALAGESLWATLTLRGVTFDTHYAPLRDDDGTVIGSIAISTDVTARATADAARRESEDRLQTLVANAPVILFSLDPTGIYTASAGAALAALGREPNAIVGQSVFEVYGAYPAIIEATRRALAGETVTLPSHLGDAYFENRLVPLYEEGGAVRQVIGVSVDVTDRAHAEQALAASEARFRLAFDDAPIGMALAAPDGRLLEVNHALCQMLGFMEHELLEQGVPLLTHPADMAASREGIRQLLAGEIHSTRLEKRYLHKQGQVIWTDYTASLLQAADGRPSYFIFQLQDITARKAAEERLGQLHSELYAQARHDPLTGLPNRVLFQDRITQALRSAERTGDPVSLLLLDLDGFKVVNDTLGHAAGDQLLQEVGRRMQQVVRVSDTVARLGGDEFVLLLPRTERSGAIQVAAKVRAAVNAPITLNGQHVTVNGSIGIALYPTDGQDTPTLLRQADTAMYAAKRTGQGHTLRTRTRHRHASPMESDTLAPSSPRTSDTGHA